MYICICAEVTEDEIQAELAKGASLLDLQDRLGVAVNCCCCLETIMDMMPTSKYPNTEE